MQNNHNLWIGLLVGIGLTGLLMYVLSQQASSFVTAPPATPTVAPLTTPFVKPESSVTTKPETEKSPIVSPKPAEAGTPKQPTPIQSKNIDLPGLPENPHLSEKELAKLSPEEREKYGKVLKTYQQVRNKVISLHQEREQLEQQIRQVIEENTIMDQQLEQMKH